MRDLKRPGIGLLCLLAGLLPAAHPVPTVAGSESYREDFRDGIAQGWELEPDWQIAPCERDGRCLHGHGHHWAIYREGVWEDSTMAVRLRLVRGGLHLNYRVEEERRYFLGVRPEGLYLSKQTGPETFFEGLATAELRIPTDRFVLIEIVGRGARLEVRIDGEPILEYTDPEPVVRGGLAFETLADGEAFIDSVSVHADPRIEPQPEAPAAPMPPIESVATLFLPEGPPEPPEVLVPDLSMAPLTALQKAWKWEYTGGPLGGLGYDVRIAPQKPGLMYVSDAWAGVFKSLDGGKSWFAANGPPGASGEITVKRGRTNDAYPVFCLTIDPHHPNVVWVGTKDRRGIFRSPDGGKSWAKKDKYGIKEPQTGITFRGFTVDPRPEKSNVVYLAGEVSSYTWTMGLPPTMPSKVLVGKSFDKTMGVVYRSDDSGDSWREIWRGDNLARYVWVDPHDPDTIFVSTGIFDREAANTVYDKSDPSKNRAGGVGVLRSRDGGRHWDELDQDQGLLNLYVGSLFMHPENPRILLAATGNNSWPDNGGVYLSVDGGDNWVRTLAAMKHEIFTSVEFSVSHPLIAYAGSNRAIYRSETMGESWIQMTPGEFSWGPPGVRAGWPIDFQVDPRRPDRLFANNYGGGNFVSTDGGATWANASRGYTGALIRDLAVDPRDGGRVYAVGRSGLFVSTDGGDAWRGMGYGHARALDWSVVAIDPGHPDHLLTATLWDPANIYQRPTGELVWRRSLLPKLTDEAAVRALAFAPSTPALVYAGTGGKAPHGQFEDRRPGAGIYRSRDGGATWQLVNATQAHVQALAVHPDKPPIAYAAASNDYGLLKTTDAGATWKVVLRPDTISVAIHPSRHERVYAGRAVGGVLCSPDGGGVWHDWTNGIQANAMISDIVFDPANPDVMWAADRASGVYRSANAGAGCSADQSKKPTWIRINNGLWNREVAALAISADGRTLYAGTEGAGVFRLVIP